MRHVTHRSPENRQALQVHVDLLQNQVKPLTSMIVRAPGELAHYLPERAPSPLGGAATSRLVVMTRPAGHRPFGRLASATGFARST